MSVSGFARFWCTAPIVVWIALQGGRVHTQEVQPVNSGANPYRTIRNWGTEPEGRPWGAANGVAIDRDGRSVWVADRCGTGVGCVEPVAIGLVHAQQNQIVLSFDQLANIRLRARTTESRPDAGNRQGYTRLSVDGLAPD